MTMSRTSFSIRRLIPSRRPNDSDNSDSASALILNFDGGQLKGFEGYPRTSSLPKTANKKPIPKPLVILKTSASVHRIAGVPPLPDTPPHSSSSSLCSCEHHGPSPTRPGFRSPMLCAMKTKEADMTPPTSSSTCHDGSPPSTSHISRHMRNSSTHSRRALSVSPVNSFESLVIPSETAPRRSPRIPARQSSPRAFEDHAHEQTVDNVQQLIQEADDAFEAVGVALAQAREASRTPNGISSPISPTFTRPRRAPCPRAPAPVHIPIVTRSTSRGKGMKKTPNIPTALQSPTKAPVRKASVNKAKRKKSKKGKRREQQLGPPPGPKAGGSRWVLSENVSDILNGSIFKRIEADELVTERQIELTRHSRLSSMQAERASEQTADSSDANSNCETPIDSFHLQDLPLRISAAKLSVPSPIEEVPTPRSFDSGLPPPSPPSKNSPRISVPQVSPSLPSSPPAKQDLLKAPAPHKLATTRLRTLKPLATIPEIMITPIDPPLPADKSFHDFIYFTAAPFSLTTSTIHHGPIRFAKSDLEPPENPRQLADDTLDLDWTAFQMAILGGAGDLFSDSTDISRSNEADDADDLVSWFAELGLDSPGALLTCAEQDAAARQARELRELQKEQEKVRPQVMQEMTQVGPAPGSPPATMAEYSPSASTSNLPEMVQISSLPIPVLQELRRERSPSPNSLGLGGSLFEGSQGLGLQSRFAVPRLATASASAADARALRRYAERGRQGSEDSLPQSPMLDLVVSRGTDGGEYVVPMGSSLGHDLKDFLGWEADHLYYGGMPVD